MDNRELAKVFDTIGDLLEIKGENPFRIRSYRRAAQTIDRYPESMERVAAEGRLEEIDGIGKTIAEKIQELEETGKLAFLEELQSGFPDGLLELLEIGGMGPKKVKLVWEELGVTNLAALETACQEGKVRALKGMGAKSEEKILKGIATLQKGRTTYRLDQGLEWAEQLVTELENFDEVERVAFAGSSRRGKETVGDIDLLVASTNAEPIMEWFRSMDGVEDVLASGKTKTSIIWQDGIQVDLRVVPLESFGAALQYFTGSKEHNVRLREIGVSQGYKINEYGIFETATDERVGGENEEDIYKTLGLSTPPPELREGSGEIEAAAKDKLPSLLEQKDLQGDLHCHTTYSDGRNTLEEMAEAAKARGYKYLAITDHSQSLQVASGLAEERLLQQIEAIRDVNKKLKGFRLLAGTEVDILSDGSLDYPDEILAQLDCVVASIHVGLGGDREKQTRRILAACENPYVHIIGHMTGRMLPRREPYPLDTNEIFKVAAETGTAIEINASPYRLDLRDVYAREAQNHGVTIVVSTDAHSTGQLDLMRYGVLTARRGWLGKADVLNTHPLKQLVQFFKKKSS